VRLLPTNLEPAALEPVYGGSDRIVIGQREEDLAAVQLDFAQKPLLLGLGDNRTGKTTLLRHVIRTIRDNSTRSVCVHVLDRRLHLVDEPLFPDNEYNRQHRPVTRRCSAVGPHRKRRPPAGLTASQLTAGHSRAQTHDLIIDDVDRYGQSGNDGTLCGNSGLDSADRITGAGRRSGTAGHRHGARNPAPRTR